MSQYNDFVFCDWNEDYKPTMGGINFSFQNELDFDAVQKTEIILTFLIIGGNCSVVLWLIF